MMRWLLAGFRLSVFVVILWLIREAHQWADHLSSLPDGENTAVSEAVLKRHFPELTAIDGNQIRNEYGDLLGFFLTSSPAADGIIGYSGPNNTGIFLDPNQRIIGVEILESKDTPSYIEAISKDPHFLDSFNGTSLEGARSLSGVDGVSGATLSSLAIAETIRLRAGGAGTSLRFPNPLSLDDAKQYFPMAASLVESANHPSLTEARDATSNLLGHIVTTSPLSDNYIGYQGPTNSLIALEADADTIVAVSIRRSYDTDKYVSYVRDDYGYLKAFVGRSLKSFVPIDLAESDIEGVSGATMTSLAVAQGVIDIAIALNRPAPVTVQSPDSDSEDSIVIGAKEIFSIGLILVGILIAFTNLRGNRRLRIVFQFCLIVFLGFVNGHLLSLAFVVGSAQNAIPWESSIVLVILSLAAILVPLATKRNVYCHQLCPHGAAQQWLRRLPFNLPVSPRIDRALRMVPFALLLVTLSVAFGLISIPLASIEPFAAYKFAVAGAATIIIAIVGLLASAFIPMAYCRYGCPTGAVLGFLWAHGRPDKFSRRDAAAIVLLVIAIVLAYG